MSFKLGSRSLSKLEGVHPNLVAVVKRAIELSEVDFTVIEGVRTLARQRELVAKKASQTLNSKHLKQSTGYGHAVDLAPVIDGKVSWDLKYYYPLAQAMDKACEELKVPIRWGGAWINLKDGKINDTKNLVQVYANGQRKAGKNAFIDAAHFELVM